ncbi:MAG: DUF4325 domain-containing protein [Gammaproteobacteria bacterium]|nr:DUF4325 domain-containing protein [Gammaproteobacteria bacterium]
MTKVRARGEDIRTFILNHVEQFPTDISKETATKFGITRQAVNKHLQKLTTECALIETGKTRNRIYKLAPISEWKQIYTITPELAEDQIWRKDIDLALGKMPDNVSNIWHYGFTEMFNNAIDHSGGSEIIIQIRKTAINTEMLMRDNGLGIFKKIQQTLNLLDERHALLELSKGKLTTDPKHHSGQGIFFTSRMLDSYDILSGGVYFSHQFGEAEDWLLENNQFSHGTSVWMKLHNHTARTTKKIFDQYTSGNDYAFSKTIVPVKLAQYGNDKLISRSEAKRLLARVELFKYVIFDFTDIDSIGQAFADEIFRVFAIQHPDVKLTAVHTNSEVKQMITRAKSGTS